MESGDMAGRWSVPGWGGGRVQDPIGGVRVERGTGGRETE